MRLPLQQHLPGTLRCPNCKQNLGSNFNGGSSSATGAGSDATSFTRKEASKVVTEEVVSVWCSSVFTARVIQHDVRTKITEKCLRNTGKWLKYSNKKSSYVEFVINWKKKGMKEHFYLWEQEQQTRYEYQALVCISKFPLRDKGND